MAAPHPPIDMDWLASLHSHKRLRLSTGVGLAGEVNLNGSPSDLVTELIRLARIGQRTEQQDAGL